MQAIERKVKMTGRKPKAGDTVYIVFYPEQLKGESPRIVGMRRRIVKQYMQDDCLIAKCTIVDVRTKSGNKV
jgi:hypothetical protein